MFDTRSQSYRIDGKLFFSVEEADDYWDFLCHAEPDTEHVFTAEETGWVRKGKSCFYGCKICGKGEEP